LIFFSSKVCCCTIQWVMELLLMKVRYMYDEHLSYSERDQLRHHTRYTQNLIVQNYGKSFFWISHPQIITLGKPLWWLFGSL
jgi:hypothetical protein